MYKQMQLKNLNAYNKTVKYVIRVYVIKRT